MTLIKLVPVISCLLLFCFGVPTYAQPPQQMLPLPIGNTSLRALLNNPTVFTQEEGFPLQNTSIITKDDQGFMWIGGRGGLVRFDGSAFTKIPLCVEGSEQWWVKDLLFDAKDQVLWIATWGYGLLRLDLGTYTCSRVYIGTTHKDKYLFWLHKAPDALWIGKSNGLSALPFDQDTVLNFRYVPSPEERGQLTVNKVNKSLSKHKDITNDSILWIGTVDGLLRFNLASYEFNRYFFDIDTWDKQAVNSIRTIYQQADGQLLLGTWGGGVVRFDPRADTFSRPANRPAQARDIVISIVPGLDDQLLVTSTDGVRKLNPKAWKTGEALKNDLKQNRIYGCKFIDEAGRVYISRGNHFISYDPLLQQFPTHRLPSELTTGMTYDVKHILGPDADGTLWVLLHEGQDIYRYDTGSGKWSVLGVPGKMVFAAYLRNGHQLYLSQGPKFYELNPTTLALEAHEILDEPALMSNGFLEHSDGSFWFSTQNHGLVRWQEGEKLQYLDELRDPAFPDHHTVMSDMAEDSLGNIWINSTTGYSVYDYQRDTFFNFPHLLADTTELADLNRIAKDNQGGIWLLSYRHGIMKVDPRHPERGVQLVFDGLIQKNVQSGLIDQQGRIWLYSKQGLECFDPQSQESQFIERAYGLPHQLKSMGLLEDGRIYLGHPGGFKVFNPENLRKNTIRPIPYISGFSVFDRTLPTDQPVHEVREIALKPNQNFFSFQFSNINFTLPEQDSFAYKLEGVDPDWVYARDRREVFYTNVPSGRYKMKLRSANNEGLWNEEVMTLGILIATPWWKTIWALLAYILIAGYLLYWLYRFHLSRQLAMAESERLKEQQEWKNNFYTNITHEFRTPLTTISGITNEIRGHKKEKELIQRNSRRLLRLINQILSLRKLESKQMVLHPAPGDIARFLNYLTESFQSQARSKHIRLVYYADPESISMSFDEERMQQLVANLIANAIQFTPQYGKVEVGLSLLNSGRQIQLKVRDSGAGIPINQLERIFDRFHQAENQQGRTGAGTGIGLSLVKELVSLMGGHIEVKSQSGQGTTFSMVLPRHAADLPESNSHTKAYSTLHSADYLPAYASGEFGASTLNQAATASVGEHYILLVEDNQDVAYYLQTILQDQYRIGLANNGRKGLEKALEEIPDIVISDVMMPEMDGLAFCTALKNDERTSHIPVILLTAKAMQKEKLEGLKSGADAYLTKPFDKAELLIRIEKLLEIRKEMQLRFRMKNPLQLPGYQDAFLQKLDQVVNKNLSDEDFGTSQLCQAMAMSRSQLHRKIKALLDIPTARFIQLTRLHRARQLILTTDKNIGEVSHETGFKDPSYFTKLYVAEFNEKPSETRS